MNAARVPLTRDGIASLAISARRVGTRDPSPPIMIANDPKLANPHKAYDMITLERSDSCERLAGLVMSR